MNAGGRLLQLHRSTTSCAACQHIRTRPQSFRQTVPHGRAFWSACAVRSLETISIDTIHQGTLYLISMEDFLKSTERRCFNRDYSDFASVVYTATFLPLILGPLCGAFFFCLACDAWAVMIAFPLMLIFSFRFRAHRLYFGL